ncbi:MAG: diaminopimelate decarboxylase [Candidatus Dadabacteria bacterium]|nr:MAG: diaminopimelate decarboxylase [Candidatus Dadabacteria bacterium]
MNQPWRDPWLPDGFARHDAALYCEQLPLSELADRFGTPLYVYSWSHIVGRVGGLRAAFSDWARPIALRYAVKANDNLALLRLLGQLDVGFDIVSGGELARVQRATGTAATTVFSGVGKRADELQDAITSGIQAIHVESAAELALLRRLAEANDTIVPVAVRINPDIDPGTHPKIATGNAAAKFGVPIELAGDLYAAIDGDPWLRAAGVACHIGSQLLQVDPLVAAAERVVAFAADLARAGIELEVIDLGGGFGIRYRQNDQELDLVELARRLQPLLDRQPWQVQFEPGRYLVGNAGVLVTSALYRKHNGRGDELIVCDAAMNDLMRPSIYGAWHEPFPVDIGSDAPRRVSLVGPICESSDVLVEDATLPPASRYALAGAGAYGSSMASNYNTRPRPAEVLVHGDRCWLIRERESLDMILGRDCFAELEAAS